MGLRGTALLGLALAVAPAVRAEFERSRTSTPGETRTVPPATPQRVPSATRIPSAFEPNRGQVDPSVSFFARGRGCRLYLQGTGAILAVPRPSSAGPETKIAREVPSGTTVDLVAMRFPGSRASAAFEVAVPLPGLCHYLVGNDSTRWVRDVPRFAEAACPDLWPGVDLRWQVLPGGVLEYSFLLAPGADPRLLSVDFEGHDSLSVEATGDLVLRTGGGIVRHSRPEAWQDAAGGRRPVAARFAPRGAGRVAIELGPVDPALPVVVDPKILVSSYLGGTGGDFCRAVAVDGQGRPVVAGYTDSTNLPLASPFQSTRTSSTITFVSRLSADGTTLVSSTYLGGSTVSQGFAVAADSSGAMYVAGFTNDTDFPVKNAYQSQLTFFDSYGTGSGDDGFVTKLAPSGSSLVWSTFLGSGGGSDVVQSIAVTSSGDVVVGGVTRGREFPVVNALKGSAGTENNYNGFLTKFNAAGTTLAWSTYMGGAGTDGIKTVSLAADDSVCFAGYTESTGMATAGAFQSTYGGSQDCMAGRISANGAALSWLTYLGGGAQDDGMAVVASPDGGAFVVGITTSTNFPMQAPLYGTFTGSRKAFVTRIGSTGGTLVYSTFLGGSGYEDGYAAALDGGGNLWVAGATNSTDFPLASPLQETFGGILDAFLSVFLPDGSALQTSTYLGGSGQDIAYGLAATGSNGVWVCGVTNSSNFPYVGGYDSTVSGVDAFLASVAAGPRSPGNPIAVLVGLTKVDVSWIDRSDDETSFVVERKTGLAGDPGNYAPVATLAPNTVLFQDTDLAPAAKFTYRVKATGTYGDSSWEVTDFVETPVAPVYPPNAPSDLQGTIVTPRRVDLAWADNSDDEDFFSLARAVGPGLFATLATPNLGMTSYSDGSVLPEKTYSWKIRAQNPVNPSLFSNTVTVTMPSTLEVAVTKGRIADKTAIRRDRVTMAGTLAYGADAEHAAFDPSNQSFTLRLGTMDDPALLSIPVPADGWVLRKAKYTWKSPKGSLVKARVVVNPATNTWTVKLTGLTLPVATPNPLRTTLSLGTDTGHHDGDWTPPTKAGLIKFPVPVPK